MVARWFVAALVLAVSLRVLFLWMGWGAALGDRVEFSTALTSWKRLKEGAYLEYLGLSPYEGYLHHHPPLVRLLFFVPMMMHIEYGVFIAMDIAIALVLRAVAALFFASVEGKSCRYEVPAWAPQAVATIYLFNPLAIATCLSRSTAVLENLCTILGLFFALQNNVWVSTAFIAVSSYISLYPIQLLVPIALLVKSHKAVTCGLFLAYVAVLVQASFEVSGRSWEWVYGTYGVIVQVTDLTPNIGLFWYFFQEVFDHFRALFCAVLQLNCFFYLAPLTICLKGKPVLLFWFIITLLATLKPYPTVADLSLEVALLPLFAPLVANFKFHFLIVALIFIFVLPLLMPLAWHSWIYDGSGNANFYYGMTLAIAAAQVFLVSEMLHNVFEESYRHKHKLDHYKGCPCPWKGDEDQVVEEESTTLDGECQESASEKIPSHTADTAETSGGAHMHSRRT